MKPAIKTKASAHVVTALLGGLAIIAIKRHYSAFQGDLSGITPDQFLMLLSLPMLTFAALFGAGHFALRSVSFKPTATYPVMGAIAIIASAAIWFPQELLQRAIAEGFLSIIFGALAGFGFLLGFLHVRSAGYRFSDDESAVLEAAYQKKIYEEQRKHPTPNGSTLVQNHTAQSDDLAEEIGHLAVDELEFYDGPLQVATSTKAAFVAAIAGALAHSFYSFLVAIVFSDALSLTNKDTIERLTSGEIFSMMAMGIMLSLFICMIILPPAVLGLHKLLKSRGEFSIEKYVKFGALAPIVAGLMMLLVGIFLTHWLILPLAVAMGAYHHLAGLEPADLPADIEVNDRRSLVGSNHIRRRVRRVVG